MPKLKLDSLSLCNSALADLGEEPISSLGDGTKASRLCGQRWPAVRDAVLRVHPWWCARASADLKETIPSSTEEGCIDYDLPEDCLRILAVSNPEMVIEPAAWDVSWPVLHFYGDGPVSISYTRRNEDVDTYDALLYETMVARMSAILAYPLTSSTGLADAFWQRYMDKLREARMVDTSEARA